MIFKTLPQISHLCFLKIHKFFIYSSWKLKIIFKTFATISTELRSQPQFCRVRESNLFFSCCLLLFYKAATADIISVYKTAVVFCTNKCLRSLCHRVLEIRTNASSYYIMPKYNRVTIILCNQISLLLLLINIYLIFCECPTTPFYQLKINR